MKESIDMTTPTPFLTRRPRLASALCGALLALAAGASQAQQASDRKSVV